MRFHLALAAVLATGLARTEWSPAALRRDSREVGGAGDGQASVAARAAFDERRFHELLLAGRFSEAAAVLSAAGGAVPGERSGGRPTSRVLRSWASLDAARAWLQIARRDWAHRDPGPFVGTFSPEGDLPSSLLDMGLRAAHDAWSGPDPELLDVARHAADALEARGTTEARLFQALVLAATAAAQEERDLLALTLAQAQDLEWGLREAGRPLPASFQVARAAGDLWLQVHRYADARSAFVSATDREPRDARAWLGLARAEARLGNADASLAAYRTFLQRWNTDDPGSLELSEARSALAAERR